MFVAVLTVMLLIVAAVWLAGLRGMAGLPGLQVIARGSSTQYKGTSKSPREIARELGVEYLLTGTVRRQRDQNGAGRIQVTPELVQVTGVRVPTTRWQEPFDAVPNNVFQVQADIASRVAQSLGVALGEGERHALAERPTRSVKAYDAYLRAEAVGHGIATSQPTALRRAAAAYEEAVALDPTFALAWAKLSRAYSMIYYLVEASSIIAERARTSAEKALDLAPTLVEARIAYGEYFVHVKKEARRALAEYALASRSSPNDAFLLTALAHAEQVLGRWESGIEHLQQAQRLDPRSVPTAQLLAETFFLTRRYPEALAAADRGIALAPDNLLIREQKAMVYLAQGDLEGARQVIRAIPPEIEPEAVVAYLAAYADLFWLLDDQQQRLLLRLGPERFDNNRASWGLCLAQTYALRGDWGKARAYADSAAIVAEAGVRAVPDDGQGHGLLGLILAYAGRLEKAIEEGERGVALVPIAKDAYLGPYIQHLLVRIYLLADQPEKALDRLEPLLRVPYYLTPKWLEIDPAFDRVRRNQRFQGILERAAAP
jgi:TolB-like protein/Flp pilus assembly protein TadD